MTTLQLIRSTALILLTAATLPRATAQETKVRVKVKADLNASPDREMGVSKAVDGDEGSFVALKTIGGREALGGLTEEELGWQLYVIDAKSVSEIKHDHPKFVWGIGPVALETIETFNGQFRVILSKPDPNNGKLMILEQQLSNRSLTGRAAAMVTEIPYDRFGKGAQYFKPGMTVGLTTQVNEADDHMLIGMTPRTTTHSAGAPIVGVMVNKAMEPIWTQRLITEPGNVRTDVITTLVDKRGSAWYLIKNVTNETPTTPEEVGYSYSLYRLDSLGQQAFPLSLGKGDHIQEAWPMILADGRMACAGIYGTEEANRNESVGVFYSVLNEADGEWSISARTPFNLQVVKKVERLQTNMHIERAWPKTDGGVYVVTERAGIETHQVSDLSGKKIDKTEWVNGAFHVMELDKAGKAKWYTEVPREMSFPNEGPGRAFSIGFSDKLFLFYNDDERNILARRRNLEINEVSRPRDALMLEFKPDGKYTERVQLADGFKRGYFAANHVWPTGEGRFALEGAPDFRKDRTFLVLIEMTATQR